MYSRWQGPNCIIIDDDDDELNQSQAYDLMKIVKCFFLSRLLFFILFFWISYLFLFRLLVPNPYVCWLIYKHLDLPFRLDF